MKKIVSMFLLTLLFVLSAVPASAIESPTEEPIEEPVIENEVIGITPYWAQFISVNPYVSVSNGKASVTVSVSSFSNITSLKITATLQKKRLLTYSDVTTFSKTCTGSYGTLTGSASVGSGTYRIKAVVTAYQNGVAKETVTVYS